MWSIIADRLLDEFRASPAVQGQLDEVSEAVLAGTLPAGAAADALLARFLGITPD
jgi:hypothetical protein